MVIIFPAQTTMGTHGSFIFRVYFTHIWGGLNLHVSWFWGPKECTIIRQIVQNDQTWPFFVPFLGWLSLVTLSKVVGDLQLGDKKVTT